MQYMDRCFDSNLVLRYSNPSSPGRNEEFYVLTHHVKAVELLEDGKGLVREAERIKELARADCLPAFHTLETRTAYVRHPWR